jgi:methylated-DNA-[protein]-cysteine S-methyltransferase
MIFMEPKCFYLPFYRGVLEICFEDIYVTRVRYREDLVIEGIQVSEDSVLSLFKRYIAGYPVDFSGTSIKYVTGSDFDKRVWDVVRMIPYGEVRSYGWVAEKLGDRKLARAVGSALSRNPLLIIIPCHRVLRSDGSIGGFTSEGGIGLKKYLLKLEGVNI